jgi:hypothetical protein
MSRLITVILLILIGGAVLSALIIYLAPFLAAGAILWIAYRASRSSSKTSDVLVDRQKR